MAQVSGTTDTYDLVGIAEDIEDAIFNISPEETPFLSLCGRKTATNTLHQWQTDTLAAATSNKQIEGDDASFTTASPTTLLSNYTQISRKTLIVSRTADKVRKYGRAKELARLTVKYGKELKRDMEFALVGNQASSAGGTGTARSSAGIESMIVNYTKAVAANSATTTPGYAASVWSAPTDGTATATLTEAMFVSGIQSAWTDGGDPSTIMLPFFQKRKIAEFTGATKYAGVYNPQGSRTAQAAVIGGVDLYTSDVGSHKLVLNRYMRTGVVLGIDPDYVSVAMLDGIKTVDLAKTGDADKKMMITEFCLVAENPDAHFKIVDLAAS